VKGLLPHTSEGIVLARVEAAADQTYFFYNQCIRIAHILTLSPISTDDGAMYLQALPSSKLPKLWKTAAAQAACGIHPDKMPSGSPPPPNLPGPTDEGRALVYFFSGVPQFSGHSSLARSFGAIPPIHVGADGHWIGETEVRSYLGVQMAPGKHSLCSATRILLGVKPTLHIGQIDVVAGKTYFVDTNTLQPVEQGLATVWLRRIAAMPKSDSPNRKALNKWSKTNFPASPDELRTCGIPDLNSTAPAPPPVSWGNGAAPASQIFFLLKSDIKRLHRGHAVDVGFDGHWAVELQTTSWTSFPVAAGEHNVCIHIGNGLKRRDHWFSSDETLFLDSVNAVNGMSLYFISHLIVLGNSDGATIFIFRSSRLDPDEAALLVAYYPHAGTHLSHSRKVTRTSVTPLPLSSAPGAFPTAASSIRLRSVPFIA